MTLLNNDSLACSATEAIRLASQGGFRVAFAESLTGGMCASTCISIPGASEVVRGGVIVYAADLKSQILHVDQELLERLGPVAEEVAEQMAAGVRELCAERHSGATDGPVASAEGDQTNRKFVGISTTGVAGPAADPQTGQKPGTVWIGVSSTLGVRATLFHFQGSRQQIREMTVQAALELFTDELVALESDIGR